MLPDLVRLLRLALPMIAAQVGNMTLGVVDTLIVARTGTENLAAMALGHVWLWGTMIVAAGVVMGVDPFISQAQGAGQKDDVALALQRGVVVSLLLAVPLGLAWLGTETVLVTFGQDPALAARAGELVRVQAPSGFGFLLFSVMRQYLGAVGLGRFVVVTVIVGNVVNALLCGWLVFGGLGMPPLGLFGAGLSQGIARLFMGLGLFALPFFAAGGERTWIPWSRRVLEPRALIAILRVGAPIGLQFGLEVWAFQISALLAGRLGAESLAANTMVLNVAAFMFMAPLGLSMGVSIHVGQLVGAGESERAHRVALTALGVTAALMLASALLILALRHVLPAAYDAAPPVAALAASVFPIAAGFQLADGVQVVGGGILRGLGRTRPAAVLNLVGYYGLALPLAYELSFRRGYGLSGLWIGLAVGLGAVALGILPFVVRRAAYATVRPVGEVGGR